MSEARADYMGSGIYPAAGSSAAGVTAFCYRCGGVHLVGVQCMTLTIQTSGRTCVQCGGWIADGSGHYCTVVHPFYKVPSISLLKRRLPVGGIPT